MNYFFNNAIKHDNIINVTNYIRSQTNSNLTRCLDIACNNNSKKCIDLFLNMDINHKITHNAIFKICKYDYSEVLEYLILKKYNLNNVRKKTMFEPYHTLLRKSCKHNNTNCIKLLLNSDIDVNYDHGYERCESESPLRYLYVNKNFDLFKILAKKIKNIDTIYYDCDGYENNTLLSIVCCNNDIKYAQILIKYGADPNGRMLERNGECSIERYPLFQALKNNNMKMVDLLIKNGTNVNMKSNYSCWILCIIDECKNEKYLYKLIINGFDIRHLINNNFGNYRIITKVKKLFKKKEIERKNKILIFIMCVLLKPHKSKLGVFFNKNCGLIKFLGKKIILYGSDKLYLK